MDRIRNEHIRRIVQVRHFGNIVSLGRLSWFGHVQRRDSEYIGRRMLKMELPGIRQRGKLKRRFMDGVSGDMRMVDEREEDTEDRERWRMMICCGDF